jgi:urea transporter
MNNPATGLFIVVALFVQSPRVAIYGMIGLVSNNAFAQALSFDSGLISAGLFGYNGLLMGLALATFHGDGWGVAVMFVTIFLSMVSTILFVTLGRLLVPYKVPPFTLPFNIGLLMYLLASANMLRLKSPSVRPPALPHYAYSQEVEIPTSLVVFEAIFKGVGQVFLADNTTSGVIITFGLCLCSPTSGILDMYVDVFQHVYMLACSRTHAHTSTHT